MNPSRTPKLCTHLSVLITAIVLSTLGIPTPAAAQDAGGYWRHYSTANSSLLSDTIQALLYTEDTNVDLTIPGLWVGTDRGLNYTNSRDWIPYTTENSALPDNDVRALLQGGSASTLWIATANGLARLDYAGTPRDRSDDQWQLFTTEDGLPSDQVLSLTAGEAGALWAGTAQGLAHYDGQRWVAYRNTAPGKAVQDLVYDPGRNSVWIGTQNGVGILDIPSASWTILGPGDAHTELPDGDVRALALGADARLWFGTAGGLAAFDPESTQDQQQPATFKEQWERWIPGEPGVPDAPITGLAFDPAGRHLWIATDGGGVSCYDTQTGHWKRFNTLGSELPSDRSKVILQSHAAITWIGTDAGLSGLEQVWETHHFLGADAPEALPGLPPLAGWVDPETGTLWVGSETTGVSRSENSGFTWQTFTTANGLGSNDIYAVWGDGTGAIWAAAGEGGISRSDDGGATWQSFTTANGLASDTGLTVWGDDRGALWVGGFDGGVSRTTDGGQTWQTFTTDDGLASEVALTIWEDNTGTVFVDHGDALLSYTQDGGQHWQTSDLPFFTEDPFPIGISLWGDPQGNLWSRAYGQGVGISQDSGQTWELVATEQGLGSDLVTTLWVDAAGRLWVGTENAGISRSADEGATWETITDADGLGPGMVLAIWGSPGTGEIWVSTWQEETETRAENATLSYSADGGESWKRFPVDLENTLGSDDVSFVQGTPRGTLWVGLSGSGIARSTDDGQSWQILTPDEGLGSAYITDLWHDGSDIWAGSQDNGVSYSADGGATWQSFTAADGLGSDKVTGVWGDAAGIWVGTEDSGLSHSTDNGSTWESITTGQGLGSDAISAIRGDSQGGLWVGTRGGGLSYNAGDEAGWQSFTTTHGLGSDFVNALWIDRQDSIWVGTNSGLSHSSDAGKTWETVTVDSNLAFNDITAVWGDDQGTLWAGTGTGVSRSTDNGRHWQPFNLAWVSALWGDETGTIWAGTPIGLHRLLTAGEFPPAVQWIEPEELTTGATVRLLDTQVLEARFVGLTFAPAGDPGIAEYTAVLSPTTAAAPVLSQTFAIGEIGPLGIAQVTFGEGTSRLGYGDYKLQLTAQGASGKHVTMTRTLEIQARPVLTTILLPEDGLTHTIALTATTETLLLPTAISLTVADPDSPGNNFLIEYAWDRFTEAAWQHLGETAIAPEDLTPGLHTLAFRATDADGNVSAPPLEIPIQITGPPTGGNILWLFAGIMLTVAVVGTAFSVLRNYPEYAGQWTAAKEYPLQQLVPLLITPDEAIKTEQLRQRLRATQAYATSEQIQDALTALDERGLLQQEEAGYRSTAPWVTRMHQTLKRRQIPELVERVRTSHPLYARTRDFFEQARFSLDELGPEEFLLTPQGQAHPQTGYHTIYTRLIAGRPPTGDDFTKVYKAARRHYKLAQPGHALDLAHRVALVISDRRAEAGARYRLYEIRQREGLAIVPLDSSLFGQIKPSRTANAILADEIDQATGQQNLYAISAPVSSDLSFFGREQVLQKLIDFLNAGQPVGIFGLRKAGKTSLIQRLQGRLTQRPIAFIDTQGTARQQGVWPLYPAIITAFAKAIERTRPDITLPALALYPHTAPLSPAIAGDFVEDLQTLHTALGEPGDKERLLLIIDEVDRLLPYGDTPGYEGVSTFFGQLRAANQQAKILDFTVVGVDPAINRRERWLTHDNELYRALHELWMPPMAPADVREMIESLGSQMGVRYAPNALELLARSGGGHPFVTRQLCSYAVRERLGHGVITVTKEEAQIAAEEFVFKDPYLSELWRNRLDTTQRSMLCTLARASAPVPRSQLLPPNQRQAALAALHGLEECSLVRHDQESYHIAWIVFHNWIRWVELGLET